MEIVVEGNDPVVVSDFANMVGTKTIAYVTKLYEAFDMMPLDRALRPTSIIRPNRIMNLIFGAIFGMALGAGLAFLADYLQAPLESAASPGILDDESGAYNRNYFTQRLREEMSRASRNNYPLSVALMDVDQLKVLSTSLSPEMRSEALRKMAVFLKQYLREEDVMARLDETVFAFLLPDISEEEAKATMEKLQTRIAWTPFEIGRSGVRLNLSGATGVVAYDHNGMGPNELIAQASRALQQAEGAGYGKVRSFQESFPEGEKGD
jgi:diguanylate cyclase (GGDEF)-like protein